MTITPEEIRHLLQSYSHILLTAHVNPDGDAIGSLAAMQDYLDRLGKQVVTVVDDDIDDKFFFLPGVSRFKKPSAVHTDDSWLTVILDATSADRCGAAESLIHGTVLNIDHHISNAHFARYEYVRPECAATGEILTQLFLAWGDGLNQAEAMALYMAIATDSGFFKFSNTTGQTLRMAAALVDAGAMPHVISEHLEAQSLIKLHALPEVLKHIELFGDNKVAGITFSPDVLKYTGEHTGGYIDYARTVKGVDVAFTVKYISDEETRVSLRSKKADVNAIASVFGGGGHVRAAGCTIAAPLEEAKKMLIKEILKTV